MQHGRNKIDTLWAGSYSVIDAAVQQFSGLEVFYAGSRKIRVLPDSFP